MIWCESLGGAMRSGPKPPGLEIVIVTPSDMRQHHKPTSVVSKQDKRSGTKRIPEKTNKPISNSFRIPIEATGDGRQSPRTAFTAFFTQFGEGQQPRRHRPEPRWCGGGMTAVNGIACRRWSHS